MERLNAQLQKASDHISSQNQKIFELSNKLDSVSKDNISLWNQVEYLTLQRYNDRKMQASLCQKERANIHKEYMRIQLNKQLEEMQREPAREPGVSEKRNSERAWGAERFL